MILMTNDATVSFAITSSSTTKKYIIIVKQGFFVENNSREKILKV